MWEAALAIVGLLAAGLGYYLKRAADTDPAKMQQLKSDLVQAKGIIQSQEVRLSQLILLNAKYHRELVNERRKNLERMSASDAAELLRRGQTNGEDDNN